MFLTVHILAVVLGAIGPDLHARSVLLVLSPVPLVLRSVEVKVDTVTVCHVIEPGALIHVTVGVDESTAAISLIIQPPSFINRSIGPNLLSFTCADLSTSDPLALVFSLIGQYLLWAESQLAAHFEAGLLTVAEFTDFLANLKHFFIEIVCSILWRGREVEV